jgi:formiminoglutamase
MLDAYFTPVPEAIFNGEVFHKNTIGGKIQIYRNAFPKITKAQIAIIGVGDQAHKIRAEWYKLAWRFESLNMVDLGNFAEPSDPQQRHFAVSEAMGELLALNIIVVILSNEGSYLGSHFHAFRDAAKSLEMVMVSSNIDLAEGSECMQLLQHPEYAKRVSNIDFLGSQAYYVSAETMDKLDRFNFENYRLGNIRRDIEETEPVLRSSDVMFFDLNSVRYADAPDVTQPSPNGLYAEEAATISRYAGLSNRLKSVTFFGLSSERSGAIGDTLVAQLLWYFVDGVTSRYHDHPVKNDSNYLIYRNRLENTGHEITFYKSRKSDRWWMEVPHPYEDETFFIGCSYKDYQKVCNGEMPDRWWRAYQRNLR